MSELWSLFTRGGLVMWPILLASVLALAVALERLWMLRRSRVIPEATVRQVLRLVRGGKIAEAREVCRHDGGPFSRIVVAGLEWWSQGFDAVREAIADAGRREAPKLMRGLGIIGTVASVTPLLGLLGTVIGMIKVFRTISLTGPGQGQELSAGIAEALLTTAFGLTVAIPALVVHNLLASRAEQLVVDIERACHQIVRSSGDQPSSTGSESLIDVEQPVARG
ncbi:MAG: MotA/TolQ/ExbB proton channel family protein [Acidobacteriota bacterium]|nr:MAG: MotA/TolQ/ExbB proton channel family protein [Acidobacteriota bacterium]